MTVSDLIARLQNIQKKLGSGAYVWLGREFNSDKSLFEFFEIRAREKDIVLVPTDIWDRRKHD